MEVQEKKHQRELQELHRNHMAQSKKIVELNQQLMQGAPCTGLSEDGGEHPAVKET